MNVLFPSDHGDWAGKYGQIGKNLPGYDPLLRIPFIWYDPRRPGDAGKCVNGLCVDFMPTLLERLGIAIPETVQGESLLPHLDGFPIPQREAVFAETGMEKTIRTRDWKLTYFVRHPHCGQLFKMGPHPNEITNYLGDPSFAHVKQDLLLQLMQWMIRAEQPHSSCRNWEAAVDTRWHTWLHQPEHDCELQDRPP